MGINDWSEQERPRERLVRDGAAALSNPELLALLLRVGVRGKSAVELGRDILQHFGSLHGLFGATLNDFSEVHGLGMAKYAQLQAVMELARRAIGEQLQTGATMESPELVKRYLRIRLGGQHHESFVVLFLDVRARLIADKELFRGTLTQASVYPREVVKAALACNAASVILAHNHPSGVAEPSHADLHLTRLLTQALALVEIRVLDHFVVAGPLVHSFAENGQL
ncbi:RadC family protein [Massilia phyllosphaerae]|uniref:RadC family protein n=1 Tax=Massilia phyllosphaerae TaxID=3106034 RepID=UPI002B1CD1FB|nr:DNA repair protein RadC [Massilia sp. SGZ-792]